MPDASYFASLIQSNPNLRRFLDLIGWAEGATYTTGFGGRHISDLSKHPYPARSFQVPGGSTTSAAGKYQFQRGTWNSVARQLGLRDFGARSQDIGAAKLIYDRGALNDVLSGNIASAINKLKPEWESFKVRPLQSILHKYKTLGGNVPFSFPNIPNIQVPNVSGKAPKIISDSTRYMFAFAILVVIFIFAFN